MHWPERPKKAAALHGLMVLQALIVHGAAAVGTFFKGKGLSFFLAA
jgi:hypothetical protein